MSFVVRNNYYSQQNKKTICKKLITNSSVITGSIATQIPLYYLWYKDYQTSSFNFFNDSKEWGYMDKMGHAFTAYHLSDKLFNLYQWAGYSDKQSLAISSSISFLYQFNIEIMDGYSSGWGFSCADLIANSIGIGLNAFQHATDKDLIIKPKFSYSPTLLATIRPQILGSNHVSRILKDYNGQTYWVSISANSIIKHCPKWLLFSIGYSINDRLVGTSSYFEFEDRHFESYAQYFLSLDIDLEAIHTKNKFLKSVYKAFNLIKIPMPSLTLEKNKIKLLPIYF